MVPSPLRSRILEQLHSTHVGLGKMLSLARLHVWWPTIEEDVKQLTLGCSSCQENAATPLRKLHCIPGSRFGRFMVPVSQFPISVIPMFVLYFAQVVSQFPIFVIAGSGVRWVFAGIFGLFVCSGRTRRLLGRSLVCSEDLWYR